LDEDDQDEIDLLIDEKLKNFSKPEVYFFNILNFF